MCYLGAYAQAGLQTAGMLIGQRSQMKAAQAQINAQAKAAITDMNHGFQNYEAERQDNFDATVSEILKTRVNNMGLKASVAASTAETLEGGGRTADLIRRSAQAQGDRAEASIQDNYRRKSNEIDLNKEALLNNTKSYLSNLSASAPKAPSALTNMLSVGAMAVGVATNANNYKNSIKAQGKDFDWWSGGAKVKTGTLSNAAPTSGTTSNTWIGSIPLTQAKQRGLA